MGGPVSVDHQTPKTRWRAPSGVLEGGEGMGLAGELLGFARADALMPAGAEPRAEVGQFIQDGVDAVAAKNAGVAHRGDVFRVGEQIVGGWQLDVVCRLVCETAGINDANWRGDWRPVIAWLRDGLDVHEQIIPAIKRAVERSNYRAHEIRSLAYFDQAVRGYRRAA